MEHMLLPEEFNFTSSPSNQSTVLNQTSLYNNLDYNGTFYYDYFDYSNYEYPKELKTLPLLKTLVKVCVYVIIIVLSLVGNILIIVVVAWNKRLQTTTNFYIVNLAVSDLLVTVSCSWVHLVDDLTNGWILGTFFCKFNSFAQGLYVRSTAKVIYGREKLGKKEKPVASLVSSIMSLTLIACDRFFGIVFAMKAHIIERRACRSIFGIWIGSVAVALPLLVVRQVDRRQWLNYTEIWCYGNWPSTEELDEFGNKVLYTPSKKVYWTVVAILLFLVPVLVMCTAYCGIIKTLWDSKVPGERLSNDVTVQTKVKRKAVIMLIIIMVVFCVCWIPLQFSVLYTEYRPNPFTELGEWYGRFDYFAKVLAFSNSAMNPVIYAGFNDNFRKGFKLVFGCYKKKRYATLSKMEESCQSTTTMTTSMSATTHITRM